MREVAVKRRSKVLCQRTVPYELYKGLAFTTIWLESADSQENARVSVCTGPFFLTKLHESNSRGLAQQEKRETDHNL